MGCGVSDASVNGEYLEAKALESCADVCSQSWKTILLKHGMTGEIRLSGLTIFSTYFFERLDMLDPDFKVSRILCSRTVDKTKDVERTQREYFIRLVRFFLTIRQDSREVRLKLRALGRRHALVGAHEKLDMITGLILLAIGDHLEISMEHKIIACWRIVLTYVVQQMCFDKLQFHPELHRARIGLTTFEEAQVLEDLSECHLEDLSECHLEVDSPRRDRDRLASSSFGAEDELLAPLPIIHSYSSRQQQQSQVQQQLQQTELLASLAVTKFESCSSSSSMSVSLSMSAPVPDPVSRTTTPDTGDGSDPKRHQLFQRCLSLIRSVPHPHYHRQSSASSYVSSNILESLVESEAHLLDYD